MNLGAKFDLGDFASIGLAASMCEGMGEGMDVLKGGRHGLNDEFMRGSMFVGISLSDEIEAELGVAYTDHDTVGQNFTVASGLYYKPVSQLVIGLEGSCSETYQKPASASDRAEIVAAMVANYSF